MRVHHLQDCVVAYEVVRILMIFDSWLTFEKITGWINWPSVELMCRRAYALEVAFREVFTKADWCKPAEGTANRKSWVSKVDWRGADRIDASSFDPGVLRLPEVDKEVRGEMQHAALIIQSREKIDSLTTAPDRLHPAS